MSKEDRPFNPNKIRQPMRHAVRGLTTQAINVVKETFNRLLGLPDTLGYLVGYNPVKKIRIQVVILRDEQGAPLAEPQEVDHCWQAMEEVFMREARVKVVPIEPRIITLPKPAPVEALDVHCTDGAWQEDCDIAGNYFRPHTVHTPWSKWTGYASPVTVFVVRTVSTIGGCSLGPLTEYVTLKAKMFRVKNPRVMAHEVGHACFLTHTDDPERLMYPKGPGANLTFREKLIMRNSRHVTYW
ncbi:MAG: hypothetical protein KA314_26910 [Chloroflexi bacterium]|nr:hypothetical protein [Chloroflexota bacterium]MBP8059483.1 hypothetical protein [Chloroflexota bacterium]